MPSKSPIKDDPSGWDAPAALLKAIQGSSPTEGEQPVVSQQVAPPEVESTRVDPEELKPEGEHAQAAVAVASDTAQDADPTETITHKATLLNDLFTRLIPISTPAPMSADQEAEQILNLLDDRFAGVIREQAFRTNVSVVEIIGGILTTLGDQGNLSEVQINPAWQSMLQSVSHVGATRAIPQQIVCENCLHAFKPVRRGQRYCCTPCGKAASGYTEEGLPHSADCTTAPAIAIQAAMGKAIKVKREAAH